MPLFHDPSAWGLDEFVCVGALGTVCVYWLALLYLSFDRKARK
jgi:hypothetical protein